ncbi:MAG TPA: substrate-binding domain-containing protein [Caulobacteraceae bacterium]
MKIRLATALLAALTALQGAPAHAQPNPAQTEVDSFPAYAPQQPVSGVVRNAGSGLNGLLALWEADFAKYQPGIRFEDHLPSGDAAIGALEAGAADLAVNGREPVLTEFLSFAEVFGNDGPFQVTVATGSYDKLGRTWAEVIFVNRDNPIAHLTMAQLDGVFGAERTGGYQGYKWTSKLARSASKNIRTWGQLGLTGAWANKPIHTYGYAPTGMSNFFELTVFHGGVKWNPNYRQYVETTAKQATDHAGTTDQMLTDLSHDQYGIAWAGVAHAVGKPAVKSIALGTDPRGPFIAPTLETVRARTYPLTRSIFIQLNRPPGTPISPQIKEFLRYILSRQGQSVVLRQGEYLPLTRDELDRQLRALD